MSINTKEIIVTSISVILTLLTVLIIIYWHNDAKFYNQEILVNEVNKISSIKDKITYIKANYQHKRMTIKVKSHLQPEREKREGSTDYYLLTESIFDPTDIYYGVGLYFSESEFKKNNFPKDKTYEIVVNGEISVADYDETYPHINVIMQDVKIIKIKGV